MTRPQHVFCTLTPISAAIDLLAEASEGNPRILGLLAQAAWLHAARSATLEVAPQHVHAALRQVPSANARVTTA